MSLERRAFYKELSLTLNLSLPTLLEFSSFADVQSVAWLEQYLVSQTQITCMIVSHDSGFLDNVCTDIMHYENKKIAYYPGNLSKFVEKVPEARSYYTLAATSVKSVWASAGGTSVASY